jgi:hypothetical protein
MRRILHSAAVVVLAAGAFAFWQFATASRRPETQSSVVVEKAVAAEATTSIAPHDIMISRGSTLPVEFWRDPF